MNDPLHLLESTRSLLARAELTVVDRYVRKHGYLSIEQVRAHFAQACPVRDDYKYLEPDDLLWVDLHVDYPIFLVRDYVYSREELMAHFPFEAFATTPERVFVQQKIIKTDDDRGETVFFYQDLGDQDLSAVRDTIRRERDRGHVGRDRAYEIAQTKIYVGKDDWKNFKLMRRFVKGVQTFLAIEGCTFTQAARAMPLLLGLQPPEKKEEVSTVEAAEATSGEGEVAENADDEEKEEEQDGEGEETWSRTARERERRPGAGRP